MQQPEVQEEQDNKYLIFTLGGELYGSPLIAIKEVIKIGEIKPVPHMNAYFRGVINLRGQIVSIVDLRKKFSIGGSESKAGLILVVEHESGFIGAVVDDLDSVATISRSEIEANPMLDTKIPLDFFHGVAKMGERLVNVIDIAGTLTSDDYRSVRKTTATKAA
jgi:purine-binding chemotaxis protein CheW